MYKPKNRTDDELMNQAKEGSCEAFDTLVRRHQTSLLGIAGTLMGALEPAKDVVQNTFMELYRFLPRYRAMGKLTPLLRRILLNQCRIAWRQRRSRTKLMQGMFEIKQTVAQTRDSTGWVDRSELTYALALLCTKYRHVIQLRFGLDLSYQEIAQALNIPIGTVKSRLSHGLGHMKLAIDAPESTPLGLVAA